MSKKTLDILLPIEERILNLLYIEYLNGANTGAIDQQNFYKKNIAGVCSDKTFLKYLISLCTRGYCSITKDETKKYNKNYILLLDKFLNIKTIESIQLKSKKIFRGSIILFLVEEKAVLVQSCFEHQVYKLQYPSNKRLIFEKQLGDQIQFKATENSRDSYQIILVDISDEEKIDLLPRFSLALNKS